MATAVNPPVLPPGFEVDPPHQQGGLSGHMLPAGFEPDAPPMDAATAAKGAAQLVGAGVMNIPHGVVAGIQDLYHRITGNADAPTTKWGQFGIDPGSPADRLISSVKGAMGGTPNGLDVSDEELRSIDPTGKVPIEQLRDAYRQQSSQSLPQLLQSTGTVAGDVVGGGLQVGQDVANVAPAVGAVKTGAGIVSNALDASAAARGIGTDWRSAGFRTGGGHPIAREVAGDSRKPALVDHNATVTNTISANEAGHDPNVPMTYQSMADARVEPNSVYNRVANTLPEDGQLDAAAQQQIQQAGLPEGGRMSDGSPDAAQRAQDLRTQLLDPNKHFNGQQIVNEVRGLRQEGFTNAASDDVSNQQLGKAQLDMARAIEGHIGRALPQNGPVSLGQFQDARQALAKNYSVQTALRGSDVDPKVLARIQRNDPELLTGGLKTIADFANGEGRDVVGLPDRSNPPNVFKDMGGIVNVHRPVQSTIQGIPGVGTLARRILTGGTDNAVDRAQAMFPPRDPDAFRPQPGLTPPPGNAWRQPQQMPLGPMGPGPGPSPFTLGEGANPNAAAPAGPPGQLSLADLLSHGVEQSPPQGLTAGPMGAPQGQGLPFRASPEMVGIRPQQRQVFNPAQAPVSLGDRFAVPEQPERLGDVAAAGLQGRAGGPMTPTGTTEPQLGVGPGVPEGIATRTPSAPPVSHAVDEQTGEHTVQSANGETHAQESGPFLISKRSDTAATAQGKGEGVARAESLIQQAESRGLRYASDVSVSPAMQRVYDALKRRGYNVMRNPDASVNSSTGNLVSDDPRKPVFIVKSRLAQALQ